MKNNNLLILAGLALLMSQSCKKTLEENPKTFVSPAAFFTSADSYEQAVKGIYISLPGLYSSNSLMMREMFSDIYGTPSNFEQALPTYENNHQPFFYSVRGEWANDYNIIKNANFILSYIPAATLLSDGQKTALTAEARFLRGFAYFQLVQFYGDVPLRVKPLNDYSESQLPRTPQAKVYDFILEDLKFAENNLPDNAEQQGRVYKSVATALLAKVYLTMAGEPLKQTQYYQNAKEKAIAIISSGKFQLMNDYADVFHRQTYSTESIWEQLFRPDIGGNGLQNASSTADGFAPILLPAVTFIASYPKGDQRKAWGIQQNYIGPGGLKLMPFFQKFVNTGFINGRSTASGVINAYTIPYLRLGEMYLIAAEAENELNGPTNAYSYINTIRARARTDKNDPTNVPDLSGLSREDFRLAVYMERKWELSQEGSTWFDLKRTGTLNRIQTVRGNTLSKPIGPYNNTWYIPDNEILNNNIPQNPAY